MKRSFLVLLMLFECVSLQAQLYSEYELCISDDSTFNNPTKHKGVLYTRLLYINNRCMFVDRN